MITKSIKRDFYWIKESNKIGSEAVIIKESIFIFMKNTQLNAFQQIILSIIVFFLCEFIIKDFVKKMIKQKTKLSEKLKGIILKRTYWIRLYLGKITSEEFIRIAHMIDIKKQVNKYELKIYNSTLESLRSALKNCKSSITDIDD